MQRSLLHTDSGECSSAGDRRCANSFPGDRAQRRIPWVVRRYGHHPYIASVKDVMAQEFYLLLLARYGCGIFFDKAATRTNEGGHQVREPGSGIPEAILPMLWSASPAGEVTHISSRVCEYSGLTLEDFLNFGWRRFIHPDDFEDTAKALGHAIQTGESYGATHRLRRADGEYRWHQAMGEPLRDPAGKIVHWYGLSFDIDERKRAEDYLRDMRVELARASQIATAAELAASIAHELNQPLMAIIANAQAAKRWLTAGKPDFPEVNNSIERVLRDAQAADETLRHIRALFKQNSFDKRRANIADIIREAVRFVHEDPKKREVPIDLRFDDSLPAVWVDVVQIQQLYINLLSNAIEAQDGGPAPPLVRIAAVATDRNEIIVQVIDNGPGLEDTERIFDAFVTTKANGMGVGLAVSRSIAEAHDGRLWAENSPDGGARFNVALPLSAIDGDSSIWFAD
jgi:PAS domain S-box-containing protein